MRIKRHAIATKSSAIVNDSAARNARRFGARYGGSMSKTGRWPGRIINAHPAMSDGCPPHPQERTFAGRVEMSANCHNQAHTLQQMASLFDHFVSELLNLQRHIETERLCSLEIYHQLELGRLLYWQVGRFGALENLLNIYGSPAKQVG